MVTSHHIAAQLARERHRDMLDATRPLRPMRLFRRRGRALAAQAIAAELAPAERAHDVLPAERPVHRVQEVLSGWLTVSARLR